MLDQDDLTQEKEIDDNLNEMSNVLGRLKGMAGTMNDEVKSQTEVIGKLGNRADDLNVRIGVQNVRLNKRFN